MTLRQKTTDAQKDAVDHNRVLRVFRNNLPLTPAETKRLLAGINDQHIEMLSKGYPSGVSGKCVDGFYVGHGTCLAKKLGLYNLREDPRCRECKHSEITDQLNWVFDKVYEGKYRAAWVRKRGGRTR